jgi:hypothetical protein
MLCCKCRGLGIIANISGMLGYDYKKLGTTVTCEICMGLGYTNNLFAVEFQFDQKFKYYWLPMFILADDKETAISIAEQTKKEISACCQRVSNTKPIAVFSRHLKANFIKTFPSTKRYKFYLLNLKSSSIIKSQGNPVIHFNEHLKFRATNEVLHPFYIEDAANKKKFPIRVIKGDASFDPPDHLVIMYRKKWNFKRMFNNDRILNN